MSTKGNYKTLNKPAIHTDSSGRDDRRSHPVGKQELCGQRHPVWRSFTVFTSACFAVPSCQQPSTIHCKQLLKHVTKMKHKHFDKNLYNWQTILKQTTNNFWWQLFHRVPAFCSYCLPAALGQSRWPAVPATAWQHDGLGPSLPTPQWSSYSLIGHWVTEHLWLSLLASVT